MILRRRKKLKSLLIGLFIIKIVITLCYLSGSLKMTEPIFPQQEAMAQEAGSKASDPPPEAVPLEAEEIGTPSATDIRETLNSLEAKRLQIEKEDARLKEQRAQLEALEMEIIEKVEENSKILKKIEEGLAAQEQKEKRQKEQKKQAEAAKMKQLVKVYTSMKPKTAAALIDKLDMAVIMKLFDQMKGEQIGQILTYVDAGRAALISERLAANSMGKGVK